MCLRSGKAVLLIGTALSLFALPATAQSSTVLALPDDVTVEVIGLRRWTIGMVQDSLGKYALTDSLQSHACAATLRYKLHFADAASTTYSFGPGKPDQIVVIVREPQDSARVHYRDMPLDTLGPRKAWRPITDVFRYHQNVFWPAVYAHLRPPHSTRPQYQTAGDSALALRFATSLRSLNRERDRIEAVQALKTARNMYDRVAAALIVGNFADRDDSWTTLAETLREREGPVKGVAATVLFTLSERTPSRVNWSPAAPGNASLSAHSRALLTALRGADLGGDADGWRAWMSTL